MSIQKLIATQNQYIIYATIFSNFSLDILFKSVPLGEIEGEVEKLTEVIPVGYSFYQEDNNIKWNNNGILETTDLKGKTIKVGEYEEIQVTLRWILSEENFGQKENSVLIIRKKEK